MNVETQCLEGSGSEVLVSGQMVLNAMESAGEQWSDVHL